MDERPPDQPKDPRSFVVPPPPPPSPRRGPSGPDPVTAIIPYNNPKALAAYYLGIFSCIPLAGVVTGVAAIVMGNQGLRLAKAQPEMRGKTHAWVGIIAGGTFDAINLLFTIISVAALIAAVMEY